MISPLVLLAQQSGSTSPKPSTKESAPSSESAPLDSGSDDLDVLAVAPADFEKLLQAETLMWQKKLYLQDWTVKVRLCRLNEMPGKDCVGAITCYSKCKDAILQLLAPIDLPLLAKDYMDGEVMNFDLTIVHELLHLHVNPFERPIETAEGVAQEQMINMLSRAFIAAYSAKSQMSMLPPTISSRAGHYL